MANSRSLARRAYLSPIVRGGSGDPSISVTGETDFGITPIDEPVDELQTVSNEEGTAALIIIAINLPSGFSHDAILPWIIPAGDSDTFTITATALTWDYFSGNVEIISNAPTYSYAIEGYAVLAGPDPFRDRHGGYGHAKPDAITSDGDGEIVTAWASGAESMTPSGGDGFAPLYWQSIAEANGRGCVESDGSKNLSVLNPQLSLNADFTWALVVRTDHAGGGTFASEGKTDAPQPVIRINTTGNDAVARLRNDANTNFSALGTKDINDELPHLLVVVKEGNLLSFFIDDLTTPQATTDISALGALTTNRYTLFALGRAAILEPINAQIFLDRQWAGNQLAYCAPIKPHYGIA